MPGFDSVLDKNATQEKVYSVTAHLLMEKILLGYNVTIFAYGQTGAGKTHTMVGTPKTRNHIADDPRNITKYKDYSNLIEASLVEIYKEKIKDLGMIQTMLIQRRRIRRIKTQQFLNPLGEIILEHTRKIRVNEVTTLVSILWKGLNSRRRGSTKMNARSSRSHVMLVLYLHTKRGVSKVNLTDLAGSERQAKTGATGRRLKEAVSINQSLSALGNATCANLQTYGITDTLPKFCFDQVTSGLARWKRYTMLIANVSPAKSSYYQTLSTLRFASRIKKFEG